MEESLTYLKEQFELPDVDVKSYSPLVLAYIGDGIYELVIRTAVVGQGNRQANALHKKTSTYDKQENHNHTTNASATRRFLISRRNCRRVNLLFGSRSHAVVF